MSKSTITSFALVGVTTVFLASVTLTGFSETAFANPNSEKQEKSEKNNDVGEGKKELERQKKLAEDLQTIRGPSRLRTNIISSVGLGIGGVVGEVSTTFFTCILKCIPGVKVNYKPGDFWRQTMAGQRKLWGVKQPPKKKDQKEVAGPPKAPKTTQANEDRDGYKRHKYDFEYRPNRFGGITVRSPNGQTFHVKYGGKIQVGEKILIAAINPTGRSYFVEEKRRN